MSTEAPVPNSEWTNSDCPSGTLARFASTSHGFATGSGSPSCWNHELATRRQSVNSGLSSLF